MNELIEFVTIDCPSCGEPFEVEVDLSAGSQTLIEDCRVCCAPAELRIEIDAEGAIASIEAEPANG
ncbi:MAG: CPXCG motif-containing cysteine-rich protein [Acidihalobacter sp.]